MVKSNVKEKVKSKGKSKCKAKGKAKGKAKTKTKTKAKTKTKTKAKTKVIKVEVNVRLSGIKALCTRFSNGVAKVLSYRAWKEYEDRYCDVIRLLLSGKTFEDSISLLNNDLIFDIVDPEAMNKYVIEGYLHCPKCNGCRISSEEAQTRSCDESKTQFNTCITCLHQWKF
jgi:DNA-directed RNA polymerase subunit M/transcription elongation factor TFIIS